MEQKLTTKEEYLKRINVIVEYINNHLDENIDLGMLAEMSGFSPWHFHRIVRAFLGEPVGAFFHHPGTCRDCSSLVALFRFVSAGHCLSGWV